MPRSPKNPSGQTPPEGFTLLKPEQESFYRPVDTLCQGLFLPTQLHSALLNERAAVVAATLQAEADQRTADRAAESCSAERRQDASKPSISVADAIEREARLARQEALFEQERFAEHNPHAWHLVYTPESVANFLVKTKLLSTDKDLRRRDEEFAQRMAQAGSYRQIAVPGAATTAGKGVKRGGIAAAKTGQPGKLYGSKGGRNKHLKVVHSALDNLRLTHPHFGEVIDFVAQHQALSSRSNAALPMTPILLNGEPGLGKTHFAFELAAVIGSTCRRVAFDTPVTASTVMGSDRRWSNTQVGLVFELVCLGQYANPVIVLDEIDKARLQRDWNPLAPLHTLLEPSTAAKVRDVSADFEFDASQVIWIATSNDSRYLTGPIRSRFREFNIVRPDASGALASSKAVLKTSFAAMKLVRVSPPNKDLAVALAHLTPREINQVLKVAVAIAIQKGKSAVDLDDLPAGICEELDQMRICVTVGQRPGKAKTWLH